MITSNRRKLPGRLMTLVGTGVATAGLLAVIINGPQNIDTSPALAAAPNNTTSQTRASANSNQSRSSQSSIFGSQPRLRTRGS